MMPRGLTGKVYRAQFGRNDDGDPIDADGNVIRIEDGAGYVGDIYGVLMGGPSASPALGRQETSNTSGQIGIPIHKRNVAVQFGDRLIIEDVRYRVVSRPKWNHPQTLTGTKAAYMWVDVDATVDG
jgi:hypothetical protein